VGDVTGFLHLRRADPSRRPAADRTRDWAEMYEPLSESALRDQGARCMDCGVPFCQGDTGCPVRNVIPDWNDLVYRGQWRDALETLHATNNFPEFTGRLCPAPCESACVLGLIDQPVGIRTIEQAIVDRGFAEGWVTPRPPARESGARIAVIGSGPAGLAAAQQMRRAGHAVTVFERSDRAGGLLRYGIPDFKMTKSVLDRRLAQIAAEGVTIVTGVDVGRDLALRDLQRRFDAVLLAGGAPTPRELDVPGRELDGIHFAMPFLTHQNRLNAGLRTTGATAAGKRVVILGGGDTGSDCLGTCHRQGAASVTQFELMPVPPRARAESTPWPLWPMQLRSSHAHEEGGHRDWSVATVGFSGSGGRVERLHAVRVDPAARPVPGSEFAIDCDLVLLAMGFTRADVVATDADYATPTAGLFAAGDQRRGASLIVWAIREGRDAAAAIDRYLAVI
jgi:glutamate synthase (NADPH) small chain